MSDYIPDRGDVVWIDFSPQIGHEQSGHRPALVLSPKSYNGLTGLAICCPITRQAKGYTFETTIPEGVGVEGVVLADHIRSLAWRHRGVEFLTHVEPVIVIETVGKLYRLLA